MVQVVKKDWTKSSWSGSTSYKTGLARLNFLSDQHWRTS